VTLSVTASAPDGGTLSYQWFSNDANSNEGGIEISGATEPTYQVPTETEGTFYYYVVVTNTTADSPTAKRASNVATVIVTFNLLYTATFYDNGIETIKPVQYGENIITLPSPTPISGYTFVGWHIDNIGTAVSSPYNLAVDTDFYAKWVPDDPATPKAKAAFYDDGIEVESISIEEYPVNYINLPDRTRRAYDFNGWVAERTAAAANPIYKISADIKFNADFTLAAPVTEISTVEQLKGIGTDATTLSGSYKLMNDIDLDKDEAWMPLGAFAGVFEGNGKTITGLYVSTTSNAGLFASLSGSARIANLTVEISENGITGGLTGGIAGSAAAGTSEASPIKVVNTHVKVKEGTAPEINGSSYSGGILGQVDNYITIIGCSNDAPVRVNKTGASYASGILGYAPALGVSVNIYNSWNTGAITSTSNGTVAVGGIAGYGRITIIGSSNTGTVSATATGSGSPSVGGIIGIAIVGSGGSPFNMDRNFNTGAVSANSARGANAGGIVGQSRAIITNSYNIGDVSATTSSTTLNDAVRVGGIVGEQPGGTISDSYNTGSLTGEVINTDVNNRSIGIYIGGIVAHTNSSGALSANRNYNEGDIRADTTRTSVSVCAGGIVGNRGNAAHAVSNNVAVNSSVTATGGTKNLNRVVGCSITDVSTVTNNFAFEDMSAAPDNFIGSGGYSGESKTDDELKLQTTYESIGWLFGSDAANPWKMPQPAGSAYPRLYWE
jgi:uncharacterized repeat protein (TIGR02543 family)